MKQIELIERINYINSLIERKTKGMLTKIYKGNLEYIVLKIYKGWGRQKELEEFIDHLIKQPDI